MADQRHLLLIPSAITSRSNLSSAYKSTLSALLPKLVPSNRKSTTRLDIAIQTSHKPNAPRSSIFNHIQSILQEYYTLVCLVAAELSIDLDLPGGLDVRIILLTESADDDSNPTSLSGPLITLSTLASSLSLPIQTYFPESEPGIAMTKSFETHYRQHHETSPSATHLPCGPSLSSPSSSQPPPTSPTSPTTHVHKSVAVGGTFDHLHIGHKLLLTCTLLPSSPFPTTPPRTITIGITDQDLLLNKKHASVLEPFPTRVARTAEFIESVLSFTPNSSLSKVRTIEEIHNSGVNGRITRYTYTPLPPTTRQGLTKTELESSIIINYTLITDPFGPTITDPDISAIVISAETRAGGKAVNDKRKEKGWKELEVFEVGVLDATPKKGEGAGEGMELKEGFADKISSTEIRRRLVEMDREGMEREGKL